ncbi:MAG: hypothetical protein LBG58_11535 [Planctomycetaceae bacterium]|jgi:hypothetical protein|nr:hypothetical protein [Planctomycetaceae bacterium]
MRIRRESILVTLVCFSLVFGVIGCRSNGGAWYNPKSYTWHNPFKSNEAPSFDAEGMAHATTKPSLGAQPNVTPPPGGYTSKEDEARFWAGNGKKENSSMVVPQYGVGTLSTDGNRVASANVPTTPATSGYAPTDHSYNPYGTANNNLIASGPQTTPTPTHYQPTNYYYPDQQSTSAIPSNQPGVYQGSGYQGSGVQENSTTMPPVYQPSYTTPATTSYAVPNPQTVNNYTPFGVPENTAAATTPAGYGAAQPAVPTYSTQPVPPPANNYGVPTATPNNVAPAAGFIANPSNYQPTAQPVYQ